MWWPFEYGNETGAGIAGLSLPKFTDTNAPPVLKNVPESSPIRMKGPCNVCGVVSKGRCGGCETFYCSKKHQQTDWTKHKGQCRPFYIPTQFPGRNKGLISADGNNEPRWMMATRELTGGTVLLSETPILITPNIPEKDGKWNMCFGCYRPVIEGTQLMPCPKCLIPICKKCSEADSSLEGKTITDGHILEECQAVATALTKDRTLLLDRIEKKSSSFVRDFCILKALQLHQNPTRWNTFLDLKMNLRYLANIKEPTENVKNWLETEKLPMAESYMKSSSYMKGGGDANKGLKLEDVVRLFAVFSDTSPHNPHLRVVYEHRPWISHSCSPTSEFHFSPGDQSFTIYVKTVENVKTDGLISVNYLSPGYKEGVSKSEIRLWKSARLTCAEKGCHCRYPGRTDGSVGIRCSRVKTAGALDIFPCPGFLSPFLDSPNPDKPNLGLLIYIKSKQWICNRCRRTEKFGNIMKQVKDVGDKMKSLVDEYCEVPNASRYLNLMEQMHAHLGEQHWLWVAANQATLASWNELVGAGKEMLARVVALPPSQDRNNVMRIITYKCELYGDGLPSGTSVSGPKAFQLQETSKNMLTLLANRYGRLSFTRGQYLLDAFYSHLIVFAEEFKGKLNTMVTPYGPSNMSQVYIEVCGKWRLLSKLLQDAMTCLSQPFPSAPEIQEQYKLASELTSLFQSILAQTSNQERRGLLVIENMYQFMKHYCASDPKFLSQVLDKLMTHENSFDFTQEACDPYAAEHYLLSFGPIPTSSKGWIGSNGGMRIPSAPGGGEPHYSSQFEFDPARELPQHWNNDEKGTFSTSPNNSENLDFDACSISSGSRCSSEDNSFLEDFDELLDEAVTSSARMSFYQDLLNESVHNLRQTEQLLQDLLGEAHDEHDDYDF